MESIRPLIVPALKTTHGMQNYMKKRCPTHMNITVTINRTYVLQQLRLWISEELPGMRQASRNWRRKTERLQINPATLLEPLLTLVREATSAVGGSSCRHV